MKKAVLYCVILLMGSLELIQAAESYQPLIQKALNLSVKNPDRSIRFLEKAISSYPEKYYAYWILAQLYYSKKSYSKAALYFKKAVMKAKSGQRAALIQDIKNTTFEIRSAKDSNKLKKAIKARWENKNAEAIKILYELASLYRGNARIYLELGLNFKAQKDSAYALRYLKRAFRINPVDALILGELKQIYLERRQLIPFEKTLSIIRGIYGSHPAMEHEYGLFLMQLKYYARALELFQRQKKLFPDFPMNYFRIGQIYYLQRRKKSAQSYLKKFLSKISVYSNPRVLYRYPIDEMKKSAQNWIKDSR